MAVGERAALGVLSRQSHGDALDEQGRERERLGVAPVDAALVERGRAALELARELRMDGEALLHRHELAVESAQALGVDGGDDVRRAARRRAGLLLRRLGERLAQAVVRGAELGHRLRLHLLRLLGRHLAGGDSRSAKLLPHRGLLVDRVRHERLRVRGLVLLVVAEAAVADEVDDDVVPEALAEGHREPRGRDGGLGIVGVHVDDRRVEALREVARVAGGAAFRRDPS